MPNQSNEQARGAKARHSARKGVIGIFIAVALAVSGQMGLAPSADAATKPFHVRAAITAKKQVGANYVHGAQSARTKTRTGAFDCSGLVQYVYRKQNVNIPRTTSGIRYSKKFRVVKTVQSHKVRKYAHRGDVLYRPGHVAVWVGKGKMVDAGNPRVDVVKRTPYSGTWTILRLKKKYR
jgi:cell wall-associated NlpC family hydrolase